jgi:prolipoprotein diacylglyceryltransferase
VARFVIEFYRGDAVRGYVFGWLSTSQFIAILMVFGAALLLPYVAKRNRLEPPATPPPAPTPAPA